MAILFVCLSDSHFVVLCICLFCSCHGIQYASKIANAIETEIILLAFFYTFQKKMQVNVGVYVIST